MSTYRTCANPECARPMRTARQQLAEHPGTAIYGGRGYCKTCVKHRPAPRPDIDPAAVARTAMMLGLWNTERNKRLGITA